MLDFTFLLQLQAELLDPLVIWEEPQHHLDYNEMQDTIDPDKVSCMNCKGEMEPPNDLIGSLCEECRHTIAFGCDPKTKEIKLLTFTQLLDEGTTTRSTPPQKVVEKHVISWVLLQRFQREQAGLKEDLLEGWLQLMKSPTTLPWQRDKQKRDLQRWSWKWDKDMTPPRMKVDKLYGRLSPSVLDSCQRSLIKFQITKQVAKERHLRERIAQDSALMSWAKSVGQEHIYRLGYNIELEREGDMLTSISHTNSNFRTVYKVEENREFPIMRETSGVTGNPVLANMVLLSAGGSEELYEPPMDERLMDRLIGKHGEAFDKEVARYYEGLASGRDKDAVALWEAYG